MKHNGETMHALLNTMGFVASRTRNSIQSMACSRCDRKIRRSDHSLQLQYKMARDPIYIYTFLKDEPLSILNSNLNNRQSLNPVPDGALLPCRGRRLPFHVWSVRFCTPTHNVQADAGEQMDGLWRLGKEKRWMDQCMEESRIWSQQEIR